MPHEKFTHLHVHSSYSLLDGIQPAEEIGPTVKARQMDAVALTDHGYMGGIASFVKGCRKADVKPIIGMESYLAFGDATHHEDVLIGDTTYNNGHFLLLAKNATGYKNLLKLTEYSYDKGFYKQPRIDIKTFKDNAEGLIVTSTCITSQLCTYYKQNKKDEAIRWIEEMIEAVDSGSFYFEVQVNNVDLQRKYNDEWIIPFSKQYDIPLVLTADAHQQSQDEWELRGLVQCVGWKQVPHKTKYTIQDYNAWMYDTEFAKNICNEWNIPLEAVTNTSYVASLVDGDYFESASTYTKTISYDEQQALLLRKQAYAGLMERLNIKSFNDIPKQYKERLDYELNVIIDFGYANYFFNVQSFIYLANEMDIPVGPARGSSGGSLLAWALHITGKHMDPVKNNLLFERFLNPGRISINLNISDALGC